MSMHLVGLSMSV